MKKEDFKIVSEEQLERFIKTCKRHIRKKGRCRGDCLNCPFADITGLRCNNKYATPISTKRKDNKLVKSCKEFIELFGDKKMKEKQDEKMIKIIDSNNKNKFEETVNELIKKGWEISSTNCGFVNSEEYDFQDVFQAILIKVEVK